MSDEFEDIYNDYLLNKYRQESKDRKYKDDESNIFDNDKYTKLREFIHTETGLYKGYDLSFEELRNRLEALIKEIKLWLKSLRGRKAQGLKTAENLYTSEVYYLNDLIIHLQYRSKILELLIESENFENESLHNGQDISSSLEYDVFSLNKCILINQIGYCKSNCLKLLNKINTRVSNCKDFTVDFYYKLGELNFTLQNYFDARKFIEQTIKLLEIQINEGRHNSDDYDMLFAAYQIWALSYEFCRDPLHAISILTNAEISDDSSILSKDNPFIERVLNCFADALSQHGSIEGLNFSDGDSEKKKEIVKIVDELIKDISFDSPIFRFVTNEENHKIFSSIVAKQNDELTNRLRLVFGADEKNADINRIYDENCLNDSESDILTEYIHILAHCLNELGVDLFKKIRDNEQESEWYEKISREFIIIARALMLYASHKRSIYNTCLATIYAEAGDFQIAKKELDSCFSDFSAMDVTTKAEVAFFYYIIDGISKISSGANAIDENKSNLQNRYLNYCYRNFDYDAISHMKLYEFKFQIADILNDGDMSRIIKEFTRFSRQDSVFKDFIKTTLSQNCNKRLYLDYEKTKYMYSFLKALLVSSDKDEDGYIERDADVWNFACKYMCFYNAATSGLNDVEFEYIDFTDYDKTIRQLSEVFPNILIEENGLNIDSDYCHICCIDSEDNINKCVSLLKEQSIAHKMLFIAFSDENLYNKYSGKDSPFPLGIRNKLRCFSSLASGLKEFLLYNTFYTIKKDFVDPQTIFVMTPINTAKSCKYSLSNKITLIKNGVVIQSDNNSYGKMDAMIVQYAKISDCNAQESVWTDEIFAYARDNISFVVNLFYNSNSRKKATEYKYYCGNLLGEAVLFNPISCLSLLDNLYEEQQVSKPHPNECQSRRTNLCEVKVFDCKECDVKLLMRSFLEVNLNDVNHILLWKGVSDPFISWRIVGLKSSYTSQDAQNRINIIKQMVCGHGCALQTERINTETKITRWPVPIDINTYDGPFLFVSHTGKDDELVKSELCSFFEKNGVPIWYDKELLVSEDTWKNKIKKVLLHNNCVGSVLLISREEFFSSHAIQYELLLMSQMKKQHPNFGIYPVIYGFTDNNQSLEIAIRNTVGDRKTMNRISELIIPNEGKVNIFLVKNQGLYDYMLKERSSGREGSLLHAFKEIGLKLNN